MFDISTDKTPAGDQPKAIKELIADLKLKNKVVLLGATGTGKTFTVANVINKIKKPTLVLVHNKTLASQLYSEMKELFPKSRVEYFISYFDYYRPEAYVPAADLYLEKSSKINDQIEMLRQSTLNATINTRDVIIVASVAAIYGLRPPAEYRSNFFEIKVNQEITRHELIGVLVKKGYKRVHGVLEFGQFRAKGDVIEIALTWTDEYFVRVALFENLIESINVIDILNGIVINKYKKFTISPADINLVSKSIIENSIPILEKELEDRIKYFEEKNKLIEKQRIEQRIRLDIEQLTEYGTCSGIENYARYLDQRKPGEPPYTLFDYLGDDFLLVIDESHITIPQINGMYAGDFSRKSTLVEYGFRLPSALDNRPLRFDEFFKKIKNVIYTSATPGDFELMQTNHQVVEQINRPTGLLDPNIVVRKTENQMDNLIFELNQCIKTNTRAFITTVTKKMAEEVANYLRGKGIKSTYLHSELKTFERDIVIYKLRNGTYDCIVGVNLLREGLDVPEVSLVAILDADKEGFLRNTRSLIQTIGRGSRNVNGRVIMYADYMTKSIEQAIFETNRRREIQLEFNNKNNITPTTIIKKLVSPSYNILDDLDSQKNIKHQSKASQFKIINDLKAKMHKESKALNFEEAAKIRDLIIELETESKT